MARCDVCFRHCELRDGQTGPCGARAAAGGEVLSDPDVSFLDHRVVHKGQPRENDPLFRILDKALVLLRLKMIRRFDGCVGVIHSGGGTEYHRRFVCF